MNTRYQKDRNDRYDADIRVFVKEFLDEKFFSYIPGRKFRGFKARHDKPKKSPAKLGIHLYNLCKRLDDFRRVSIGDSSE